MKFNSLIPELSVSDINVSKEFYLNLGFEVKYERIKDKFVFLQMEGNQIMLNEINGHWNTGVLERPFGRGINLSMNVKDPERYYFQLQEKGFVFFRELMKSRYICGDEEFEDLEFLLQDPDGYLLRFNS